MILFKITEKLEYNAIEERYEVSLEATSKPSALGGSHLLWQHAYAESMEDARSLAYLALATRIKALKENYA